MPEKVEKPVSAIPGFHKLSVEQRIEKVSEFAGLTYDERELLRRGNGLGIEQADKMVENVITTINLPVGIATNFLINGKDYLVPMALEEPSVIAGASNSAKMARMHGGFTTTYSGSVMEGHVQIEYVPNLKNAMKAIEEHKNELLGLANAMSTHTEAKDLGADVVRAVTFDGSNKKVRNMIIAYFLIDCKNAMGANVINKMAEAIAPKLSEITGGRTNVRILTNYSERRLATAEATFDRDALGGSRIVERIISAYEFADSYLKRAVTHNKGVMNGITPIATAFMQDTRAIESGSHAYATRSGKYRSLTEYTVSDEGHLVGRLSIPIAVGTVGGSLEVHPMSKLFLKILGIDAKSETGSQELASVMAAVGLAQNVAALRSLAGNGIIDAHMKLHDRKKLIRKDA